MRTYEVLHTKKLLRLPFHISLKKANNIPKQKLNDFLIFFFEKFKNSQLILVNGKKYRSTFLKMRPLYITYQSAYCRIAAAISWRHPWLS